MDSMDVPGSEAPAPAQNEAQRGRPLDRREAIAAIGARGTELDSLRRRARALRDQSKGRVVTYSRKAFFPITNLCRDRCAYCTFRRDEGEDGEWTMTREEIRDWASRARSLGCFEALLCLGDRPEAVSPGYRRFLEGLGHRTTIDYVVEASGIALEQGLLPHSNPGLMSAQDMSRLRPVNVSLGMMLETTSTRLRGKGYAHYYAPDKEPALRLQVLEDAGRERVPFTTGLLLGIGETLEERVDALLAIDEVHRRHGHIQEIILQNFRAKPEIPMATSVEPEAQELAATVATARLLLGADMNIQIPPNLSPDALTYLLESGINDFGGISPITPDFVNPEAPWPHIGALARSCAEAGYELKERLAIYPEYVAIPGFLDPGLRERVQRANEEIEMRHRALQNTADRPASRANPGSSARMGQETFS